MVVAFFCFGAAQSISAATFTVTNTNDNGPGSLRQAVLDANGTPANDIISFNIPIPGTGCVTATGVCTITLASEILLDGAGGALNISGPGANRLTISGGGVTRIFTTSAATVTISGVTLANGNGSGPSSGISGGALLVSGGTVTLRGVHFLNNTTFDGGAIFYSGGTNHRIENSTFSGNSTSNNAGGIYVRAADLTIVNTTFSGNTAAVLGGAIVGNNSGTLALQNVTITGNSANHGGGVWRDTATLTFSNSIIAGNTATTTCPDIEFGSGTVTSQGYNLVGDSAGDSTNTNGAITYQSTDILDTPPLLDALANYGGTVPTRRLQPTSPAIDKGSLVAGVTMDARNVVRPFDDTSKANASGGNGADIGAFELQTSIVSDWGYDPYGQLGLGNTTTPQTTPQTLSGFSNITQFGGGYVHSTVLLADGTVATAGYNLEGELGDGTTGGANRPTFAQVTGGNVVNITSVSAGALHSLALRSDGTVWAWGYGNEGELGNGSSSNSGVPVHVGTGIAGFDSHVIAVSAGSYHNLALTDDGKVWSWGYNSTGQLGDGSQTDSNVPLPVRVSAGGPQLSGVVQIGGGNAHSAALKADGTVFVWGNNRDGQAGNGTAVSGGCQCIILPVQTTNSSMGAVVQLSVGSSHNVAINTAGDVYAWGEAANGRIGDGNIQFQAITPRKVPTLANVVRIEAHDSGHTMARLRDGTMFIWGYNPDGAIGNGTTADQTTPLNISSVAGAGGNLGTNVSVFGTGYSASFASTVPTATTPSGASTFRGDQFSVAFPATTVAGQTQVRTIDPTATGLTVPAGYTILANSTGYDISSTATFADSAQVCIKVPNVISASSFALLYLLHDDNGDGVFDTTMQTFRNYQKRELCRATLSFSPIVVATGPAAPTAAGVSVSGRVLTSDGRGLRNATVVLIDEKGNAERVRTGAFGSYTFAGVSVGRTYVISIESNTYRYSPRLISLDNAMSNLDFVPTANARGKAPTQPTPAVLRPSLPRH